jgi:four helix bundle protein
MSGSSSIKKLETYTIAKKLVIDCYEITHDLNKEEKTKLTTYLRDAAVTAFINIAQGVFLKKKKKRKKFIQVAQHALVIIDAAIEVLVETRLATEEQTLPILQNSSVCYQLLNDMKKKD